MIISDWTQSSRIFNSYADYCLLTTGLFLICLAQAPNLKELIVSSTESHSGAQFIIRAVFEFPPRLSDSSLVILESR